MLAIYLLPTGFFVLTLVGYLLGESTPEQTKGLLAVDTLVLGLSIVGDFAFLLWNKREEQRRAEEKAYYQWWCELKKIDDDLPWGIRPNQIRYSGGGSFRRRSSNRDFR